MAFASIVPFMFTLEYFTTSQQPIITTTIPPPSTINIKKRIIFPPVSISVPRLTITVPFEESKSDGCSTVPYNTPVNSPPPMSIQQMFHCGNKTHDSLFVCFHVLQNKNAMVYHRESRKWKVLERQYKIKQAAALRDDANNRRLAELFPGRNASYASPAQIGKIDDELTNELHPIISVKTFIALCWINRISVILIDDDLRTMCVVQNSDTYPKNSVHTRQGQSCILWNNNLDILQKKVEGYQNIMPHEVGFVLQLILPQLSQTKKQKTTTNTNTKKNTKDDKKSSIKSMSSYKLEELQALCIALNISYTNIQGTGKGNKILKKDLYDIIVQQCENDVN